MLVTLAEVKQYLRVTFDDDDALLEQLLITAQELCMAVARVDGSEEVSAGANQMRIGILYAVKRMGLRVPEDVSIIGFTNDDRATSCDPMLTTVEQRGVQVGEEAADILIGHVEGNIPLNHAERRIVRTRLILRGTTR